MECICMFHCFEVEVLTFLKNYPNVILEGPTKCHNNSCFVSSLESDMCSAYLLPYFANIRDWDQ